MPAFPVESTSHAELRAPDRHGDADAEAGLTDFAVNVQPGPPEFLRAALAARLDDLAAYPAQRDVDRAVAAAAALHGRDEGQVLLLGGAAEGFELLAKLAPRRTALIQPSFTEPDRVLRAAGADVVDVVLDRPWRLRDAQVPDDADLVVVGNPTNPTSVLHPREEILALRRPGRIVVVDEAFADLTLDEATGDAEPQSLASGAPDDVIVIRSITKTFGLAGLRAGYLLAAPELIERLTAGRRHWPLGTLALTALAECLEPRGQRYAAEAAQRVVADRDHLIAALMRAGFDVAPAAAPYVLICVPHALEVKAALRERGFGLRSCANFRGLTDDHVRLAVRSPDLSDAVVAAMQDVVQGLEARTETEPAAPTGSYR